jgi:hypothetical protein
MAHCGRATRADECLLSGEEQTWRRRDTISAHDPKQIFSLGVRPIGGFGFFTKTFDIGFRLIWCLVDVLADLGNALVFSRRVYVDDETRSVGSADDPPIRESRVTSGDEKNGCQKNPMQH